MGVTRAVAMALTALLTSTSAAAAPASEGKVTAERCKERLSIVLGAEDVVRERVPEAYELVRQPGPHDPDTQRPLIWVSSIHCEALTVDGVSAPTTRSIVAAMVQPPDGRSCLSAVPGVGHPVADPAPFCDLYLLWEATNSVRYADLMRSGTSDYPVSFTEELFFEEYPLDLSRLGTEFRFRSGPSAPFGLASDFVIRERPGSVPVMTVALWADTAGGTVKVNVVVENVEFGEANGTVRTDEGSELAEVFGGEAGEPAAGFSVIGAPRWSRAVMTKTIVG